MAELLFERGRPGHELEAEAVVDHGEAAGGEREALAVSPGDVLAGGSLVEGLAALGSQLFAQGFNLTAPERADQAVGCRQTSRRRGHEMHVARFIAPLLHFELLSLWRSRENTFN